VKRWPVPMTLLVGLIVADVVSSAAWIRIAVFVALVIAGALVLRFAIGWPWSRILRYREPH
jgi:hypothetical protein